MRSEPAAQRLSGWPIVGWCTLMLATLLGGILIARGTNEAGLRTVVRTSAQTSFVLFNAAFAASALAQLSPSPATRWLLRNRRYVGVSFAVSHFMHLGAIVALAARLGDQFELGAAALIGGGLAYVFIAAMTATSFDRSAAWLGPRNWQRLHTVGVYWIWGIFFVSYVPRAAIASYWYAPFVAVLLGALGLRVYAGRQRRRRHRVGMAAAVP